MITRLTQRPRSASISRNDLALSTEASLISSKATPSGGSIKAHSRTDTPVGNMGITVPSKMPFVYWCAIPPRTKLTLQLDVDLNLDAKRDSLTDPLGFLDPYYGPGHQFGWYHPGPFVEGDKCIQNGKFGTVHRGRCVQVSPISRLVTAAPLTRQPGSGLFGLPFARDLSGVQLFRDDPVLGRGTPCIKNGRHGILRDAVCVVVSIADRRETR